jgi:uncharacterized radical SAM superfamily Fe-S cluster-containing enzyme
MPAEQHVRGHIFHELTRSLCPECSRVIDAQVLFRDGAVYLRKHCPDHGWHEALISSDAGWHLDAPRYSKPGAIPFDFATTTEQGCPFDCGLCPEHQQHTCLALIEITTHCNLSCPICFANSGQGYNLTVSQVEAMLDRLLETEGPLEVLQFSGGEPTVHPNLADMLAAAKARNIHYVSINTNGLRLAQEPGYVRQLAQHEPYFYLQFDGLAASTYETLRGRDLFAVKTQALDNLAQAGLYAVLVATVVEGVNDGELGDMLNFGLEHPAVLGVSYQPATYAGRHLNHHNPLRRTTLPDVLLSLEVQTGGLFRVDDFRPVPCPHPTCSASTYAYIDDNHASPEQSWFARAPRSRSAHPEPCRRVIPIPRLLDVDDYLDFLSNRTLPDLSRELQPVLEALWSMGAVMGSDETIGNLTCLACDLDLPLAFDGNLKPENFFMVQVHGFMDEHTFDLKRLMKCCIHQLLPDGRAVPFCAYNTLGYRQEIRRLMRATDLAPSPQGGGGKPQRAPRLDV